MTSSDALRAKADAYARRQFVTTPDGLTVRDAYEAGYRAAIDERPTARDEIERYERARRDSFEAGYRSGFEAGQRAAEADIEGDPR